MFPYFSMSLYNQSKMLNESLGPTEWVENVTEDQDMAEKGKFGVF